MCIDLYRYMAFTSLAFVVLLGVVGVMAGNFYFWITFTVFHVGFCMFMTVQIYHLGRWKLGACFATSNLIVCLAYNLTA